MAAYYCKTLVVLVLINNRERERSHKMGQLRLGTFDLCTAAADHCFTTSIGWKRGEKALDKNRYLSGEPIATAARA